MYRLFLRVSTMVRYNRGKAFAKMSPVLCGNGKVCKEYAKTAGVRDGKRGGGVRAPCPTHGFLSGVVGRPALWPPHSALTATHHFSCRGAASSTHRAVCLYHPFPFHHTKNPADTFIGRIFCFIPIYPSVLTSGRLPRPHPTAPIAPAGWAQPSGR